ncbi:hypothetical protein ACXIUT_14290 [Achromobacter denitrificans]|uniref:hypothetical protein n=1 Tax=Achromobacter TaxID=222 RepID=UPI001F13FE11|nr:MULTISPECIES: hypothetical protein [Achromobacter]
MADLHLVLPWRGYTIKTIVHPHFGAAPVRVYAIALRTTGPTLSHKEIMDSLPNNTPADGLDPVNFDRLKLTEDGRHFVRIPTDEQALCAHAWGSESDILGAGAICTKCHYRPGLLARRREDGSRY